MNAGAALLPGAVLFACARPLELPPLQLSPLVPDLQRLVAGGPPEPAAARLESLLDLGRTAFDDGDQRLRTRSRDALLAEPGAFWALERLLEDADASVRSQAAFALGETGHRASVLPLVLRLKYEADATARVWVASALAQLDNGAGLQTLITAMDAEVTAQAAGLQAIEILRRAGRELAPEPTYATLGTELRALAGVWSATGSIAPAASGSDPATEARIAARLLALTDYQLRPVDDTRFILARLGRVSLPLLRRAIAAQEPFLRTHALEILRELGPLAIELAPATLPLLGDHLCRVDAARALAALRADAAAPFLRTWLADADVELRAVAAGALGPLGDRAAEPLLLARMRDEREAMDVRVQAAFSVALFDRDRPAMHFLRQRLAAGDYHAPTLREILERIESWPARKP